MILLEKGGFVYKILGIVIILGIQSVSQSASFKFIKAQSVQPEQALSRIALIYKGNGSCIEDCSESAAVMAKMAGLEPVYVFPNSIDLSIFKNAVLWIQPGGESLIVAENINPDLQRAVREFVGNGGGYVGFCAGAFFADSFIHQTNVAGLGIFAGFSKSYINSNSNAAMLEMNWNGQKRLVYREEGPYLEISIGQSMFVPFAYYPTGEIASAYGYYGRGKVIITGVHPEAPQYWRDDIHSQDPDGLDYDLAIEMINWAKNR